MFKNQTFTGERALFQAQNVSLSHCTFEDGESPLKESRQIQADNTRFAWRYPLWHDEHVSLSECFFTEDARAALWYTDHVSMKNCTVEAPKTIRRCQDLEITDTTFPAALETLWFCQDVRLKNVSVTGDYFAMNCSDLEIDHLELNGKYSFDGTKNVVIRNSRLITKDAFWNSENITVYDSYIFAEYLGWNSKNLTFINCTIESNQGLCCVDHLVMRNCKTENTTLAFEYSTVDVELTSGIVSVFNPKSGSIKAPRIDTLILEEKQIHPEDTVIDCPDIGERLDKPDWIH